MSRSLVRRLLFPAAAIGLLALSGCVAYPAPGYYGYGYGAPAYVAAPPVVIGVGGGGWWGGRGWGRWR